MYSGEEREKYLTVVEKLSDKDVRELYKMPYNLPHERKHGWGKWQGGGGVMNWEIGIDMYTLICIKWMTNKNLLYKKINKIKFKIQKK